jgi:diguanylate cyclase (GGDEF)-like protein
MFFGSDSKLKEEIEDKNEEISTLQLAIKELNEELDQKLKIKAQEVKELNKKIETKTDEIDGINKKLNHKTRALEESLDNLERISNSDTLTGAYNKRYFYDVAESVISIAKREKQSLTIAVVDINDFKEINDTHGYKIGDSVLQTLVHRIKLRESDVFVRFSEKEFVIIFPNTDLEHALIALEKTRKDIESCIFVKSILVTVSIGVHEYIMSEDNIVTALTKAKTSLSKAGKNSIYHKDETE